jgi:hypothetical protein
MGCGPKAVYVGVAEDLQVESLALGGVRKYVVTPKKYWGLPMASTQFMAGLRLGEISSNGGVTVKYQWSLDGVVWKTGATLIPEKTQSDDYTGDHVVGSEKTPFGRLLVEVRDTTSTAQVTAEISVYQYVRYL